MDKNHLPELSEYNLAQIESLKLRSPVFAHYLNLLNTTPTDDSAKLRHFRQKQWTKACAATLTGHIPAVKVCSTWSRKADEMIQTAWQTCQADTLPWAVFALGKLGAEELNLSSDVDLLLVSHDPADSQMEAKLRQFRQLLSATTEFGFCLRTDFDLRPGGRFGPAIPSIKQFEDYYWSQGETWERLAFVRLRPICGHTPTIAAVTELAQKFVYRKFLDYSLLSDLKELRTRIQRHLGKEDSSRIHLKLAIGGIRDIELFIHALQVIHGGRNPSLRTHSTTEACERLMKAGVLPAEDLTFLSETYWFLRDLENRAQAIGDMQTHWLDPSDSRMSVDSNQLAELRVRLNKGDALVSSLLGSVEISLSQLPTSESEQKMMLSNLRFSDDSIHEVWPNLMKATALSQKSDRDERVRQEFLFRFVHSLAKIGLDRDLGLQYLLDFVKSTRAKATFFSLLIGEPRLLNDLARLFSASPYLASIITSRPELIDSVLFRLQNDQAKDIEALTEELAERRLLTEVISAMQFLMDFDLQKLTTGISQAADDICHKLLEFLRRDFSSSKLDILTLGKWGGGELGLRSDLDLIFLTPETPSNEDFKLAKRMIARLNDQHKGGRLYSIDLRLRPSGHAGPLIISHQQLREHLLNKAEPWERQSYLRARSLSAICPLPIREMIERGLSTDEIIQLKEIRIKLIKPHVNKNEFDLKYFAGGLLDIELGAQAALLKMRAPTDSGNTLNLLNLLSKTHLSEPAKVLLRNYPELRKLEQLLQLTSSHAGSLIQIHSEEFRRIAALKKMKTDELLESVNELCRRNCDALKDLDPTRSS